MEARKQKLKDPRENSSGLFQLPVAPGILWLEATSCQFLPLFSQDLLLSGSVPFLLLSAFVIGFVTESYVVGFGCSPLKSQ